MTVINESGLYSLVLSSKLPGAKKFKRWVTSEVLPSIRKTGHYTANKPMTDYQMESIRVRKAQLLERLAKEYDGTYRQVLQAHATKELTGEYLLPLPYIGEKTYSAQEIGAKLGISANKVGMLANRNHLKTKQYGAWFNDAEVVDSRDVAEWLDIEHKNLLTSIRGYILGITRAFMDENSRLRIKPSDFFIESTFENRGKQYPCYLLTKKGCDMVANKMTGEKGVLFTAQIVRVVTFYHFTARESAFYRTLFCRGVTFCYPPYNKRPLPPGGASL